MFRKVIGRIVIALSPVLVAEGECPQYEAWGLGRSASRDWSANVICGLELGGFALRLYGIGKAMIVGPVRDAYLRLPVCTKEPMEYLTDY